MYTMKIFGFAILLLLGGRVNANVYEAALAGRDTDPETAYLNSVCLPNITNPTTAIIPPCQEISNIESACAPNGTTPLALLAHAQCMCTGSYFSDWIGCLNCDFVHGGRSPAVASAFHTILTSASNELCTGTPTASFQAIFQSLQYNIAANGSATVMTDLFPSKTEVSLYYTPTGVQGPGVITGSATGATRVESSGTMVTGSGSGSRVSSVSGGGGGGGGGSKTSGGGSSASVGSGSGSGSSTSSSKGGASPTGVWMGGLGVVAGIVGMVVL